MTRRFLLSSLAGAAVCALQLTAADKPNFSGSWTLNADKSDFGPMPKPQRIDYVMVHKDPELNVKSTH